MLVRHLELVLDYVDAVMAERRSGGGTTRSETALAAIVVQRGEWAPEHRVVVTSITNATQRYVAANAPAVASREVREAIRLLLAEHSLEPADRIAEALVRAIELRVRGGTTDKETRARNAARADLLAAAAATG